MSVSSISPADAMPADGHLERHLSPEALWLSAICMLDMVTTLWWISQGQAREGNPLMGWVLHRGHVPFIAVKVLTFLPAVAIAEWYRPRNPRLILKLLRWVIVLYVFVYTSGVAAHYGKAWEFYRRLLLG